MIVFAICKIEKQSCQVNNNTRLYARFVYGRRHAYYTQPLCNEMLPSISVLWEPARQCCDCGTTMFQFAFCVF